MLNSSMLNAIRKRAIDRDYRYYEEHYLLEVILSQLHALVYMLLQKYFFRLEKLAKNNKTDRVLIMEKYIDFV